ncbi:hypothetical protein [Mucilaginibacter kameinonensis]|uniref:hypothetical protein n=1 Tax=Mucilaginibacter kameinonensis TaxID=452286 RepID=UPI0013CF35C4|nr:hypothetical protein [Mucilaginibacter kameinonensis]
MITITSQPQKYTPVMNNPVIFQLRSDRSSILYFIVKVLASDNSIISTQKYYTVPPIPLGTYFDLSSILSNYVDYQLVNTENIVEETPALSLAYKLQITEYYLSIGVLTQGDTLSTGLYDVWNGEIDRTHFTDFNYKHYTLSSGYTGTIHFLTHKPTVNAIYKDSTEYLYYLNDGQVAKAKFDFYGQNNQLVSTQYITGVTQNAGRLNVSPNTLTNYFGTDFSGLFGHQFQIQFALQFGDSLKLLNSYYYTVQLTDSSGNTLSEKRTYVLKDASKCRKSFQLMFSNPLGGFDSLSLFNPQEQISSEKTTIGKYPFQLNSSGVYSDINNGIYNETSTVINITNTSQYTAITDVLSDDSAKWLRSIITAEKVYVRLDNSRYYPVTLFNSSYTIRQKKYSTDNNRLEITFTCDVPGLFD